MRDIVAGKTVLVLGAESRAALAVVRSLGSAGMKVMAAAPSPSALAKKSKYASVALDSPDPAKEPERYEEWLVENVSRYRPDLLLPVTDLVLALALRREQQLRALTVLPSCSRGAFDLIEDKGRFLALAAENGLAVPKTVELPPLAGNRTRVLELLSGFPYPAVLKPCTSVASTSRGFFKLGARYARDAAEAQAILEDETNPVLPEIPFLLQEEIRGPGVGVFTLCRAGETLASFAHRRLLEKPPQGGVSVLSESTEIEPALLAQVKHFLAELSYEGVAMMEFKKTTDGRFYIMELNPRFWGSLQLAVDSGRDFPLLLAALALSIGKTRDALVETCRGLPPYHIGQRLRWLMGTVDHAMTRIRRERAFRDIFLNNSLQLFRHRQRTKLEVARLDDPLPFLFEVVEWVRSLIRVRQFEQRLSQENEVPAN